MKYLWPSPGNSVTLAKLDKLREEFKIPDDWIIEVDHKSFHLQSPNEPHADALPELPRCECLCHRGKQADHDWGVKNPICPHCGERVPI